MTRAALIAAGIAIGVLLGALVFLAARQPF